MLRRLWRESLAQDYRLGYPSEDQIASRVLDRMKDGFARLIGPDDAGAPDLDHRYPRLPCNVCDVPDDLLVPSCEYMLWFANLHLSAQFWASREPVVPCDTVIRFGQSTHRVRYGCIRPIDSVGACCSTGK
jgi:hypothetical protein